MNEQLLVNADGIGIQRRARGTDRIRSYPIRDASELLMPPFPFWSWSSSSRVVHYLYCKWPSTHDDETTRPLFFFVRSGPARTSSAVAVAAIELQPGRPGLEGACCCDAVAGARTATAADLFVVTSSVPQSLLGPVATSPSAARPARPFICYARCLPCLVYMCICTTDTVLVLMYSCLLINLLTTVVFVVENASTVCTTVWSLGQRAT